MTDNPYIGVHGIHKSYTGHGRTTKALGGVELTIERGSFVSIVGPSGCGKSTLLRLVANLTEPTAGSVEVNGKPVSVNVSVHQPPASVVRCSSWSQSKPSSTGPSLCGKARRHQPSSSRLSRPSSRKRATRPGQWHGSWSPIPHKT